MTDDDNGTSLPMLALNIVSGLALLVAASWFSFTWFSMPKEPTTVIRIERAPAAPPVPAPPVVVVVPEEPAPK